LDLPASPFLPEFCSLSFRYLSTNSVGLAIFAVTVEVSMKINQALGTIFDFILPTVAERHSRIANRQMLGAEAK
jgi:hypothetical protein